MRKAEHLLLLLVAFLSGAILMALEIVGSRLLAPNFGGSIFVWGSLIGVFLAALSLGYYAGGRLADRAPHAWVLALFLFAAGLFLLLLPRYGQLVSDAIALRDLGPRASPLLASLALFLVPGVLMGTASPYVIRLAAQSVEQVGGTAGAVYAVSTIGSIVGTLGTAFYLLSWLGARNILYLLGCCLLATALVALAAGRARRPRVAGALAALGLLACGQPALAERVLLERDSPYHRLVVTEDERYRYLRADNLYHSVMDLKDPHGRGLPYADYADIAFLYQPNIRRVLVIGLGGGTVPKRFVRDYPQVTVDAVDIDPDVVKIAQRYFQVKRGSRLRIHQADGRMFLRRTTEKWDMILLDAYYADSVPFFLCTREFFRLARSRLNPGGVLVNNVIGQATGPRSRFFRSVYRTMREVFPQVHAFRVAESDVTLTNFEVFGINSAQRVPIEALRKRAAGPEGKRIKDPQLTQRLRNYVASVRTSDVPTLTDDYAPVDALIHIY